LDNDGILIFHRRIYISFNEKICKLIHGEAHKAVYMAHPGVKKMYEDLKRLLFWKGMKKYIVDYMARCLE